MPVTETIERNAAPSIEPAIEPVGKCSKCDGGIYEDGGTALTDGGAQPTGYCYKCGQRYLADWWGGWATPVPSAGERDAGEAAGYNDRDDPDDDRNDHCDPCEEDDWDDDE